MIFPLRRIIKYQYIKQNNKDGGEGSWLGEKPDNRTKLSVKTIELQLLILLQIQIFKKCTKTSKEPSSKINLNHTNGNYSIFHIQR
jgi:hypothetical protein